MDLDSASIQLLAETPSHYLFFRDNLVALVERTPQGCGSIGSTGIWTERGLAYLVWRDGQAFLAGKGFQQRATDHEVAAIRNARPVMDMGPKLLSLPDNCSGRADPIAAGGSRARGADLRFAYVIYR